MGDFRNHHIGAATEYAITAELLRRGHEVAIPVVDIGVDLVVDYGIKIQVKTSQLSPKGFSFAFHFGKRRLHLLPDVWIFVGRDISGERHWIIPSTADAEQDDPTIRRCIGRSPRRGGVGDVDVEHRIAQLVCCMCGRKVGVLYGDYGICLRCVPPELRLNARGTTE